MAAPRKYPPSNALADIEMLACKGHSTIGLAKHFGVSRPLIVRWFEDYPHFEEAYEQGRDMYRQTLEEQIIQMTLIGKNPAGLIYLLKAKFKMYDVPNPKADQPINIQLAPVMVVTDHGSNEDWAAKAAEQQRNLTAIAGSNDKPLFPPGNQPALQAPAWVPRGRK